jgi:starch phosphorylase
LSSKQSPGTASIGERALKRSWPDLHFGDVKVTTDGENHVFEVQVYLGGLDPDDVRAEIYADGANGREPVRQELTRGRKLVGANGFTYGGRVSSNRPITDYTPRVIPHCPGVAVPLEAAQILWQR